jgi:hypothetical protein
MHRFVIILFFSLVAALGAAGCSSGAPSCTPTFTPCGGNVVGTWVYQTTCGANTLTTQSCPSESLNLSPNMSGRITFNPDGTFSESVTVDETGTETIPASCLGGVSACTQLDASISLSGITVAQSSCSGNVAQSCTCTLSETGSLTQTGTYTTAGTDLSTAGSVTQSATPLGYCANGSLLLVGENSANTAYAIFTRQ